MQAKRLRHEPPDFGDLARSMLAKFGFGEIDECRVSDTTST